MDHPDKSQDGFDKCSMPDLYKQYPYTLPTNTPSQQKLIPAPSSNPYQWNGDNQGNYFSMCGSPVFPYLPNPLDSFGRMVSSVSTASNMLNYFLLQNAYNPQMTSFPPLSSASLSQCYPAMSTSEESKEISMFPSQTSSTLPVASFNSSPIYPYVMHPCLSHLDMSSINYSTSQALGFKEKNLSGIFSNVPGSRKESFEDLNSSLSKDFSSSLDKSTLKTSGQIPMRSSDLVDGLNPSEFNMCCSNSLSGNFEKSCKNECQDVCDTTLKKKNSELLNNGLKLSTDTVTKECSYEKMLYRNIISEMNMDILFDNELEEWLTKVTVKSLLDDTSALLHQYSTSVYLDHTSSTRSNFDTYKYKFKKTSAELTLIQYTVSSQCCAVCQEVSRPMELAFLGDLLVYCKDCGLAVHRRCYGVHRIFFDDKPNKHYFFLCSFCQIVRRFNKKKTSEAIQYDKKEIACAICCRHYNGTTEPEAFHPISNHANIWVHTYCAFLSRQYVQIKDVQFLRNIEWISPIQPYSATTDDTKKIFQTKHEKPVESLQGSQILSKTDTRLEYNLESNCKDSLNENVMCTSSTVVCCMFCFKTNGVLLKCSTVNCSNYMHLYCLKQEIRRTEQDGKSSTATTLTVTLGNPHTSTTSFILSVSCLLHLVTPSYCLCRKPFTPSEQSMMVGCDVCGDWLHGSCIGSNEVTRAIQKEYYKCLRCEDQSFYFQFLDLLWSTFPLEHEDHVACRQFLIHLFMLESSSAHCSTISPFLKVIPLHTDPLPFTDILLLCFGWQWRVQALLLVDRVTLLPATSPSLPEKNSIVRKISLNKRIKLAGHRQEVKSSEAKSFQVESPISSLKKKVEIPVLPSSQTKSVNKRVSLQEKIKRKSEFKSTHTMPSDPAYIEKFKKNHKTSKVDIDVKRESRLLKPENTCPKNYSFANADQDTSLQNDSMGQTWSITNKDVPFFKSNLPGTPVCTIRGLLMIQSLAQCLPIDVDFWVKSLKECIGRCQSWVHDVKECLELGDVEKLDKLVNYFSLKTIAAFVASTKDNISGVLDNGITVPRTCYLNITSPYWAAVLVTQEAVNIRVTAIIEVFLKKHYSYVFETPTKFLDAMKIKFIKTEILRVSELQSLQEHSIFTTCQMLLNRIQECKTKAYQLKNNSHAPLKEIQELLETVENEVPHNHQIELYNFPEVLSKAKKLEEQVDWSNLRSIRETLNQAQQLPVTSDVFDKLQILIQEVDSWRKEYHRFISLVKATPSHMLPTAEAEKKDETHNIVVSGRSGFLKNLFVSSTDPNKIVMDKLHDTRSQIDSNTTLYTQSQTLESALKLMEKKSKINVQCDEVTVLQEWISQCQKWIDDVKRVLGLLCNSPFDEGVQNSAINCISTLGLRNDCQKTSNSASWQLPLMENLLRRKAELPLAVPSHFLDRLSERVNQLQYIENRANKVTLKSFVKGNEDEQFLTRVEAEQLATDTERLIQGISSCDTDHRRVLQLERSYIILNENLRFFNAWETVVRLSLQLTDLLLWDLHDTEFDTVVFFRSQIDPIIKSSVFNYPPKLENPFYHCPPILNIQNIWVNPLYQIDSGHDWKKLYTYRNSLLQFQTDEIPLSLDIPSQCKTVNQESCSQECMDPELFEYEKNNISTYKTGVDIILKYWEKISEQLKNVTALTLDLRQSLVQWTSLLLIHFVLLQHPHESRGKKTLQCFVDCLPFLLFSLNVDPYDFIPCLIPSCDVAQVHNSFLDKQRKTLYSNNSLHQLNQDGERDAQEVSNSTRPSSIACNYFLLKLNEDYIDDCIGRLFCFQFIIHSSLLDFPPKGSMDDWLKLVRQNPPLPACSTEKHTSWSHFPLFHCKNNSLHDARMNLKKDAVASPMHICVLDNLGIFVTQILFKKKSCLELDILLRVQQITWTLRSSFVLHALDVVSQTHSFLTEVTLEHVTALLREYKMCNLQHNNDMYEKLVQYIQQLDTWISETTIQLTQPCVTYGVLPQIMLTNKYLYKNDSTLFIVLGVSSSSGSDSINYSNLLLKKKQWDTPVYHNTVRKFLCSEQVFRQRWLYESLNGSCGRDTTSETFTQDLQQLHQDLLCIDTCRRLEMKPGYCDLTPSSVHQGDLIRNSLVSTDNLLELLHRCQADYDIFYTDDFSETESLSTLQAPLSYSSAQSFHYASNHSDVCYGYWCVVSQESTSSKVHNCCYASHLCLMRQFHTVLHEGYAVAACLSHPTYDACVTCFDGVQPASEIHHVEKISANGKIRVDLHRLTRETYKVAQESVISMYVTYASDQYTHIQRLLGERPVLCYQDNVYLQLLYLRRDIIRWAISTAFVLLKSVGSSNWTLNNHEFFIVDENLQRCSTLESFISLEGLLKEIQTRSKNVMQQLLNIQGAHSEIILNAFGVKHVGSSDLDVSDVGGSFHYELMTRINTVTSQVLTLEETIKKKRNIDFLKAVYFWNQFLRPYFDVKVLCETTSNNASSLLSQNPSLVESQKGQNVVSDFNLLYTSTLRIQNILLDTTRLYSNLEEFSLLFLTLILMWCVQREEQLSENILTSRKMVLSSLPTLLLEIAKNHNYSDLRILPFLHVCSDFGVVTVALKDEQNPDIHNIVFLHSEVFLWVALSLDIFVLNYATLSELIPQHSKLYEDTLKSMKTLTNRALQEHQPFLSQALHCYTTPYTLHDVPEALALPIDIIKWRLIVRLHMIPCIVPYSFLHDILKEEKVLSDRLKRQTVYRVGYSHASRNTSNQVSAKDCQKTFFRFFPIFHSLGFDNDFNTNSCMSSLCSHSHPVSLLTNAPQRSPYDLFLQDPLETLQLKIRHQATTLALNKIQWNLDALKNPPVISSINNVDVEPYQYCNLTIQETSQSLIQTFIENCVNHFLVETLFMYLEDVFQWQKNTESLLEFLRTRKQAKEIIFSQLNFVPVESSTCFNKWSICDLKDYKKFLRKLWDVYELYDDPFGDVSINLIPSTVTLQQLCSLYDKGITLHCHARNGSISDCLSRELSLFIKTVTDLEFEGETLLQKCDSIEADWKKYESFFTHTHKNNRMDNDNLIQRSLFEYLSIEEIEVFLMNSSFIHLKSHSKLKKIFRLYLELEYLATVVFSQETLDLRNFVPHPIESSFSFFLNSSNENRICENLQTEVDDNLTQPFSKSQLVFLVYTRAMPNSLQVYSVFRIKILQQCWIIAARCAIKGFYGYSTQNKECVCLNNYGIPMKTLQLMCLASRSLFSDDNLPPELQLFKILLAAAKRFLFEARTTLDTWIRLRIMVQYYPVLVFDEMQLIQEKLKTKFPNLSIEIVKEENKMKEVQVYKDKNIKTRYIPSEPLEIKEFPTYNTTINRWRVVSSILNEAAIFSDQDVLVQCYNVFLENSLLKDLLETKIRDATRDCLCKLFPKGSVSDAFDREQLLYETAGSKLNEHYFIALQEMMLKRLQQSVISRRVLPHVSCLNTSFPADTETFSINTYATNSRSDNKSIVETQKSDPLHTSIDALLMSKPKTVTAEYKKPLEHCSTSLQTSTQSSDTAIPSKFQFPSGLELNVLERIGFIWSGFLKIHSKASETILKKHFSLPNILEEKESEFQIWLVPLFAPIAEPLLLFLRTKSHFYLKRTIGIEEFANYANPIYSSDQHATVMLLNVIIGADWSKDQESDDAMTISTEVILQKCLRPSILTVTYDVPKCQIPSEQTELLEHDALRKSLQVLCFSTSEEDLEMSTTETVRLWIIPPEPVVVESFISTDFPKSSQLLFGTLEIPITLLGETCCVNGSLSDVREYAASVVLSLKNQKANDELQKGLPKFQNLRITLPRTTFQWITKQKQPVTCPALTCETQENKIEEKCNEVVNDSINNTNQSDTSVLFRIPKRLRQCENQPSSSTAYIENASNTFGEDSETSSITLPVQEVKPQYKINHKPCFSKRNPQKRHSPIIHYNNMEHRRPSQRVFRNVVQKFSVQGDTVTPQWKRQSMVSNPAPRLLQPNNFKSARPTTKYVVPKVFSSRTAAVDPYAQTIPLIPPQPESHRPFSNQDPSLTVTPQKNLDVVTNRKTTPPWKQQKVNSTNFLPFKVPPALKTLIRGAAAELRLNQPTHLPPFH